MPALSLADQAGPLLTMSWIFLEANSGCHAIMAWKDSMLSAQTETGASGNSAALTPLPESLPSLAHANRQWIVALTSTHWCTVGLRLGVFALKEKVNLSISSLHWTCLSPKTFPSPIAPSGTQEDSWEGPDLTAGGQATFHQPYTSSPPCTHEELFAMPYAFPHCSSSAQMPLLSCSTWGNSYLCSMLNFKGSCAVMTFPAPK